MWAKCQGEMWARASRLCGRLERRYFGRTEIGPAALILAWLSAVLLLWADLFPHPHERDARAHIYGHTTRAWHIAWEELASIAGSGAEKNDRCRRCTASTARDSSTRKLMFLSEAP